jgi:hypothetical protein
MGVPIFPVKMATSLGAGHNRAMMLDVSAAASEA